MTAKKRFDVDGHLTREEFRARFEAEKLKIQRLYCTAFGFWRNCPLKRCRKDTVCAGDARVCLLRAIDCVPREVQFAARELLLTETRPNLPAPERAAREIFPNAFTGASASFRPQDIPAGWTRTAQRGGRTAKAKS